MRLGFLTNTTRSQLTFHFVDAGDCGNDRHLAAVIVQEDGVSRAATTLCSRAFGNTDSWAAGFGPDWHATNCPFCYAKALDLPC